MRIPQYPYTVLYLLLIWAVVALALVLQLESVSSERWKPFLALARDRFGLRPSKPLVILVAAFLLLAFLWLGTEIGAVQTLAFFLWMLLYIGVVLEAHEASTSCPEPVLVTAREEPKSQSVRNFFFSLLYAAGCGAAVVLLLALSIARHRLLPQAQEQAYLGGAWFFIKGDAMRFFEHAPWTMGLVLRLFFAAVPYLCFLLFVPLLAVYAAFIVLERGWEPFHFYRLIRSYVSYPFDCFRPADRRRLWTELVRILDYDCLEQLRFQSLLRASLLIWVFGGLGFILVFDDYAKIDEAGVSINDVFSFAEKEYSWERAESVTLGIDDLPSDTGFAAVALLRLKDGRVLKLWSYYVFAGNAKAAGREAGLLSTADMVSLLAALRQRQIPVYSDSFSERQARLLKQYEDEEVKRSVELVTQAFQHASLPPLPASGAAPAAPGSSPSPALKEPKPAPPPENR